MYFQNVEVIYIYIDHIYIYIYIYTIGQTTEPNPGVASAESGPCAAIR